MVTDNAHLLALNRVNGEAAWETEMADWHQNYNATSAPLVVGDLVITGTAGGEEGARGFWRPSIRVHRQRSVALLDRSAPGEPGSETWKGKAIEHGGGGSVVHRRLRSAARHRLLADGQSRPRLQRRRARRRQPVS